MGKPDLYIPYAQFSDEHQNQGLSIIKKFAHRLFGGHALQILIIDNSIPEGFEKELANNCHLIAGDNSSWDFSGWDKGVEWIQSAFAPKADSIFLFANDTFYRSYGKEYLTLFRPGAVKGALERDGLIGFADDAYPENVELFGISSRRWIRTSLFILNYRTLQKLLPLAITHTDEQLFSPNWQQFFHSEAPLSRNYQQFLKTWLFGHTFPGSSYRKAWHSQGELTPENFFRLKKKTRSILSEHFLSARAANLGIPVFDVRGESGAAAL